MDEELHHLEAELKRLQPATPSRQLAARIGRELAPPPRQSPVFWWLWRAALPAVALAILIVIAMRRDASRPPLPKTAAALEAGDVLKPVAAENVLYSARDEGLVTLDDGSPARRERLNYVDTITWRNPRTNASLKWSVPREEVRIVPVSFQ